MRGLKLACDSLVVEWYFRNKLFREPMLVQMGPWVWTLLHLEQSINAHIWRLFHISSNDQYLSDYWMTNHLFEMASQIVLCLDICPCISDSLFLTWGVGKEWSLASVQTTFLDNCTFLTLWIAPSADFVGSSSSTYMYMYMYSIVTAWCTVIPRA